MINLDRELCIGCGACAADCNLNNIILIDGKAKVTGAGCFRCGHCIAVCPVNAVTLLEHDMSEVIEYDEEAFSIDPERLLNFIKFRRSKRRFTKEKV